MANLLAILSKVDASVKNVAIGGLVVSFYVAILLYILYNSSLLPPVHIFPFGQPVFRSSKERRRARLRDARASKCSSGDSGDSGIEVAGVVAPHHEQSPDSCVVSVGDVVPSAVGALYDPDTCRVPVTCAPCTCSIDLQGCGDDHHHHLRGGLHSGGTSRQSLGSGSVSSSLDGGSSTSTSITTISCTSGSLAQQYDNNNRNATHTVSNGSDSSSSAGGGGGGVCLHVCANRNSFHVCPAAASGSCGAAAAAAPTKIRRCVSDVSSSSLNSHHPQHCSGGGRLVCGSGKVSTSSRTGSSHRPEADGGSVVRPAADGSAACGGRQLSAAVSNDSSGSSGSQLQRLVSCDEEDLHRTRSLKRSRGSAHLRRSVSQPLDLNKTLLDGPGDGVGTRDPHCVSAGHHHHHHYPHRRPQRRPSTGDLLSEEHTTSEEEAAASDGEERRGGDGDESCVLVYAEALWDHVTLDSEELVFRAGELITVVDRTDHDWWWGRIGSRGGWFPVAFVRVLVNQQEHLSSSQDLQASDEDLASVLPHSPDQCLPLSATLPEDGAEGRTCHGGAGTPRKSSMSGLTHDQIRANVIKEIITTERDFVKHLRDVVEGYLKQARRRPDMFTHARVCAIFGNMEELYAFQTAFLADLEACIDWTALHKSCVGQAFIANSDKFEIYSEYCNNHPFAVSELQELYQQEKYVHFFEACRLLQEMINISLDGFLLTPVQKICKYPLQLQELLKYTKPEHPDHASVQGALSAMREAALLVNERRRRMECLEKIAAWQMNLEGWEGAELLSGSSQLLHQGEVVKGAGSSWPKEVTMFLFDRQLIYCKRDIIKRNTYVYRGRINLDQCTVEDLADTKDGGRGVPNAWKIHCRDKNKAYVFACKTHQEKVKWLDALRRERELVAGDEQAGFLVSDKTRELAREAARTRRTRPKKPRTAAAKSHKRGQVLTHAQAEQLVNLDREQRSNSLPSHQQQQQQSTATPLAAADTSDSKRRGLWFSFGGQKKSRSQTRTGDAPQLHQQQPTAV